MSAAKCTSKGQVGNLPYNLYLSSFRTTVCKMPPLR